ncbi:hypothetical protein ES705_08784 [subsurface metagenome]
MYVSGDYLFIADTNTLQIFDISDPNSPSYSTSIVTPGAAVDVFVEGNYAYIADYDGGLYIVDISDPTSPSKAGNYTTSGVASEVFISGNYAYLACNDTGLQVIDISDPTNPSFASSYNTPGSAIGVWVEGNYAYIADGSSGLQVIDITDPTSPVSAGFFDTDGIAQGVCVMSHYAFIADGNNGLLILAISDQTTPKLVGTFDTERAYEIWVSGDYAYIADGSGGISIVDISDPTNPVLADSSITTGIANGICVEGNYAFIADNVFGLVSYDISDPTDTKSGSRVYLHDYADARAVFVEGDYAYVTSYQIGLHVIDISDPTSMSMVKNITLGNCWDVYVSGDYAYVAEGNSIQVVDISNPSNPTYAGSTAVSGDPSGIYVSGDYAYLACMGAGLQVVSIADPTSPSVTGSYDTPKSAEDVFVIGDYAYIADGYYIGNGELEIIDISDPTNPVYVSTGSTPGSPRDVFVSGDYAYIADYDNGLAVIEVNINRGRQYDSPSVAQSSVVFTQTSASLTSATLTSTDSVPSDTDITYYLSADNGAHWEQVTPNLEHPFVYPGNQLKWKAVFTTSNITQTPTISSLSIDFNTVLDAPSLITPINGYQTNNPTPTFEWGSVDWSSSYLLQVDTSTTFSSLIINETILAPTTTYTLISDLSDGLYYWRVAAIDSEEDLGTFASYRSFSLNTAPPTIDSPDNITYEQGQTGYSITWNPTDSAPNYYIITKDGGFLESGPWSGSSITIVVDDLHVGTYIYLCNVYDEYGNNVSDSVKVEVFDTTIPLINENDDFSYEQGTTGLNITWIATDLNFDSYVCYINDIASNWGYIWTSGYPIVIYLDDYDLSAGIYNITIEVGDAYGNNATDTVFVTVTDTTAPNIDEPENIEYGEGTTGNNIAWTATDYNSGTYVIYWNDTEVDSGTWLSGTPIVFDLDALSLSAGIHNITIVVSDAYGNNVTDTVIVTVVLVITEFNSMYNFSIILVSCLAVITIISRKMKFRR